MQGFHISPEKRRYGTHTYIYTYTLFKLEIQCSCKANIFEKIS